MAVAAVLAHGGERLPQLQVWVVGLWHRLIGHAHRSPGHVAAADGRSTRARRRRETDDDEMTLSPSTRRMTPSIAASHASSTAAGVS